MENQNNQMNAERREPDVPPPSVGSGTENILGYTWIRKGKVPVGNDGRIAWIRDKEDCRKTAISWAAETLVSIVRGRDGYEWGESEPLPQNDEMRDR